MALVHVYVEGDVLDVQGKIKAMDNVLAIFDVTGECESIIWVACKDRDEFSDMVKRIVAIHGVKKTNTYVILNLLKDPNQFIPRIQVAETAPSEEE